MATAAEIMTTDVVTTTPDASIWSVVRILIERRYGGMPVLGPDGALIGMVSGFDVISKDGATIGDIMSRGVVWVTPEDSLEDVIQLMGLHGIRRTPVCTDGRLIGIISRSDLLRHYARTHETDNS